MKWTKQLSNENIVFLYLENLETLSQFNNVLKDRGIKTKVKLPIFGEHVHFHSVDESVLDEMENSNLLKQLKEVNSVLEPIALLIKDSDPDLYKQVEESINTKFDI